MLGPPDSRPCYFNQSYPGNFPPAQTNHNTSVAATMPMPQLDTQSLGHTGPSDETQTSAVGFLCVICKINNSKTCKNMYR
jgi:hypothetical protein